MEGKKSRNWMFTVFGDEKEIEHWKTLSIVKGFLFGEEICPETKRPHLQGYLHLSGSRTLKFMKSLHPTAHWDIRRGTVEQAITYCSKDGKVTRWGDLGESQGERTDIEMAREMVLAGKSMWEISLVCGYQATRHAESMKKYEKENMRRTWIPIIRWYWGPSGSGKSRAAELECPEGMTWWRHAGESKFWESYTGQRYVILEELRPDTFTIPQLLIWLDRYETKVPVKGSYMPLMAEIIVVTTTMSPKEFFALSGEDGYQLTRRINVVKKFEIIDLDQDQKSEVILSPPSKKTPKAVYNINDIPMPKYPMELPREGDLYGTSK